MSLRHLVLCAALLVLLGPRVWSQSLEHSIPLDDGDPTSPDTGFGVALSADGIHAYAPIAGNLFGPNNDDVALLDVIAGIQIAVAQTGAYPEDAVLTYGANGAARHVYVTDSTSSSVTCLTPLLAPVATILLPGCSGGSSYPFGALVAPAQDRLYVTTIAGCGDVFVIDTNPASPTFNTVLTSFTVQDGGGRPSWGPYPTMVVPTTVYDAFFTMSRGGFAIVDVTNPAAQQSHLISPAIANQWASAVESVVIPGGRVLLSVGYEVLPTLYECDIATGAVTRTLDLSTSTASVLHGLATNPGQTLAVITSLNAGDSVFVDVATFTVVGAHDHGPGSMPNDAVFTPDGSRVVVSLQGAARVDVLKDIPGHDLTLAAPASVNIGAPLTYAIDGCESGQGCAIYFSLTGAGPQQAGPYTIQLSNPFYPAFEGTGDVHGNAGVTFSVPNDPAFSGLSVFTQAGTVDRDGDLRLSNGARTLLN
jgi:hypothetical protein